MTKGYAWARAGLAACALFASTAGAHDAAGDTPVAATGQHSIADFAQLPRVEGPKLSPDGKTYAAQLAVQGKQYLAIVPLDGSPARYVNAGDVDLNWWHWVNNDWLVIGVGQELTVQADKWYVTRAMGVSADTKKMVRLTSVDAAQNGDDVIWYAHDGSARVLIAYQTSIYTSDAGFWPKIDEVDLATGHRRAVQAPQEGVMSWFADGAGTVRMGIGHDEDGRSTRVLYRPRAGLNYRTIDRAKTRDEHVIMPSVFLDDSKALMIGDDDDGYSALYELDLKTLERGKQLFASKGYDINDLVIDDDGSTLLGVSVNEDRPAMRWLDPDLAALDAEVNAAIKGAHASITSFSQDHRRAIVLVSSAEAPGAYFIYDRTDKSMTMIAMLNDTFAMHRLHPVRTIHYQARDGLDIAAVLTLPRGRDRNLPVIVMPHGGPFARDTEEWDWWAQFLADRGYAVVQPNYRGSSGYGTPFTQKGEGQWGLAMQDDLNDAVTALAAKGIADPKRVCMVGASYGGYAAMRAAERDGKLYRCAVSYAGVSDLNGMTRYDSRFLMAATRKEWLRKQAPDLGAVSPINDPTGFSIPILLVHGAKDRTVPVSQSRNLAQKLRHAGKDVTYIEQPLADHHFTRADDRLEFLKALDAFLQKYNPA